ncbi:tubulin-tyrosine ligase family protein [Skeletonema marinoi]|uniref:Tubulin-tyrosine ligase family protein n=1 Tax=Skeletonema marinoi TaxID=267567 RepID=A0AAD8YA46_9STRA|nr:tubulin-tyrosine ligase family protein [Skeletonema marinoi]
MSEGGRVFPNVLFDDVATFEGSPDKELIDEQDERPPSPTVDASVDGLESPLADDVNSCSTESKDSPRTKDTLATPIDTNISSDEERSNKSLLIGTNEDELQHDREVSPLTDDVKATLEAAQVPTEIEQHASTANNESDDSQLSALLARDEVQLPDDATPATSTTSTQEICHDGLGPRNNGNEFPATRKKGRQRCDLLPSFSSIFTKFQKKSKSHIDDSTQKELVSCMQHQIRLHELYPFHALQSDDDSVGSNIESLRFYRINSRRPEIRALLDEVFSHYALTEWNELPDHVNASSWNLLWTWGLPKASDFDNLLVFQKINRFRHTKGLSRKDLLMKNMQRFGYGHLMPLTYALPHEYNAFVAGYTSIQKLSGATSPNFWIVKPIGLSRGRGISVVKDISQVAYSQPIVIQKYISNPMLFLDYKFDLRVYLLVTSFQPLEAFIYKEGLARFGSRKYSNKPETLGDTRVHLTNTSLQKEFGDISDRSHPAFLAGSNGSGSKVALSWLWKRLKGQGVNTAEMWRKVVDVCGKALESVDADIPNQPNSFELFGFDVIFDTDEKCWLIEVNSSPSLSCDSSLDSSIKGGLIVDTISLVDPVAYDRSAVSEVCKRRITHRKAGSLLEEDLCRILPDTMPRRNGEIPKRLGKFERIKLI